MSTQFRSDDTVKWWLGFGNGSDGDYSSAGNATDAPVDSSCSGSATSTSLSATNASFAAGKPVLIHQTRGTGAGNWELNQIDSYTSGTITLKKALQNTYTDSGASQAQVIQLKQYNNFTQNSGHTLTAKAWDGNVGGIIAFFVKGKATIAGNITALGKGFGGGSNSVTVDKYGTPGESYSGVGTSTTTSYNNNNGGGGCGYQSTGGGDTGGGGGGHASSGGNGQWDGDPGRQYGRGGSSYGTAQLTTIFFGSGGGSGGDGSPAGNGGGIVFIFARELEITGTISVNGQGGTSSGNGSAGGGSGGSFLGKCEKATIGSNKITSTGGAGGTSGKDGGNGSAGRNHIDYSKTLSGTTSPTLDATLDPTIKAGGPNFFAFF